MYEPPALGFDDDLAELVALAGGKTATCRALGISPRTLQRWHLGERPPLMALRLLWYAGARGRAAAALDLDNELRIVHAQNKALRDDLALARVALSAALAARDDGAANDPVQVEAMAPTLARAPSPRSARGDRLLGVEQRPVAEQVEADDGSCVVDRLGRHARSARPGPDRKHADHHERTL